MTDSTVSHPHHATFEELRRTDVDGNQYWLARQLAPALGHSQRQRFLPAIERTKTAFELSGQPVTDHFEDIRRYRYACYLIVQNGAPSKPVIANGQTYFAIQTRRQELENDNAFGQLSEDEKRLAIQNPAPSIRRHNPLFSTYRAS